MNFSFLICEVEIMITTCFTHFLDCYKDPVRECVWQFYIHFYEHNEYINYGINEYKIMGGINVKVA